MNCSLFPPPNPAPKEEVLAHCYSPFKCFWYERTCYCPISTNPRYPHREGAKHQPFVDRDEELIDKSMLLTCKQQGWRRYWPEGVTCIILYFFCNDYNESPASWEICYTEIDSEIDEDVEDDE